MGIPIIGGGWLRNRKSYDLEKRRFQEELREMVDPQTVLNTQIDTWKKQGGVEINVGKEPPSPKQVLDELAHQAGLLRKKHPGAQLMACVGMNAFVVLTSVISYAEVTLGILVKLDDFIPPWDVVVLRRQDAGKSKGGIL